MVRVHHCYRFVSQKVFSTSSEPTSGLAATSDGLVLVATARRHIQVFRILEDGVEAIGQFSTLALVDQLRVSDLFDYALTLEEKSFQTFVRVYFGWRHCLDNEEADVSDDSASKSIKVKLALDDSTLEATSSPTESSHSSSPISPSRYRGRNSLNIVEIPLKDHASAVATCPVNGDIGVAVNRTVFLYCVLKDSPSPPPSSSCYNVSLKFILNLDQVASKVSLCDPFIGVVYATAEFKVFRIDPIEDEFASLRLDRALSASSTKSSTRNLAKIRSSRSRGPRVIPDFTLRAEAAIASSTNSVSSSSFPKKRHSFSFTPSTNSVVHLRRPNADYSSTDAPTSSLPEPVLLPAVAQERRYEGTENFDMIDLESLEGFSREEGSRLLSADNAFKPSLCLYKSFQDHHRHSCAGETGSSSTANPGGEMRFFRRKDADDSVFCLISGLKEGYLYSLPLVASTAVTVANEVTSGANNVTAGADDAISGASRRSRLLATYPFTSPPLGFFSDGFIIHALTDNGLESFPCRSFAQNLINVSLGLKDATRVNAILAKNRHEDGGDVMEEEREAVKSIFPPDEVCLLGLASFIGVTGVTFGFGHVILLSKSSGSLSGSKDADDDSWSLYALKEMSAIELEGELSALADRYKRVSLPIYANLLRESVFLLLVASIQAEEVDEALEVVFDEALLRCFHLNSDEAFDPIAARALAFLLKKRLDADKIFDQCLKLWKRIGESKKANSVVQSARSTFLHRLVVDLCQKLVPSKSSLAMKQSFNLNSEISHLIVVSHEKLEAVENFSLLCCVGLLPLEAFTDRAYWRGSEASTTNERKGRGVDGGPCFGLLISLTDEDKEAIETPSLESPESESLIRRCVSTPAIFFRESSWQSVGEGATGAISLRLSKCGRFLFRHRLKHLAAILARLVRNGNVESEAVVAILRQEAFSEIKFVKILEHLYHRLRGDGAIGQTLLGFFFSRWENSFGVRSNSGMRTGEELGDEVSSLSSLATRHKWLDKLAPFAGTNPRFIRCRRNDKNDVENVNCVCETCAAPLLNLQTLLADPSLKPKALASIQPKIFAEKESDENQRRSVASLRALFLFRTDFGWFVRMMMRENASVLTECCAEICGEEEEKWKSLLGVMTQSEDYAEYVARRGNSYNSSGISISSNNSNQSKIDWDCILKTAALSLPQHTFVATLPRAANVRFLAPYILVNRQFDQVRKSLVEISSKCAQMKA